jgi:hypothetical protein
MFIIKNYKILLKLYFLRVKTPMSYKLVTLFLGTQPKDIITLIYKKSMWCGSVLYRVSQDLSPALITYSYATCTKLRKFERGIPDFISSLINCGEYEQLLHTLNVRKMG